jgi:hypothetical protein
LNSDWNRRWPCLPAASVLLPAILLSTTVLLPLSVWVLSGPGLRATGTRLCPTGSGTPTILLPTCISNAGTRSTASGTGSRCDQSDAAAATTGTVGTIAFHGNQKGPPALGASGPSSFLCGNGTTYSSDAAGRTPTNPVVPPSAFCSMMATTDLLGGGSLFLLVLRIRGSLLLRGGERPC